jgi:hypothetical protein
MKEYIKQAIRVEIFYLNELDESKDLNIDNLSSKDIFTALISYQFKNKENVCPYQLAWDIRNNFMPDIYGIDSIKD